jgi:hypothetical protein
VKHLWLSVDVMLLQAVLCSPFLVNRTQIPLTLQIAPCFVLLASLTATNFLSSVQQMPPSDEDYGSDYDTRPEAGRAKPHSDSDES